MQAGETPVVQRMPISQVGNIQRECQPCEQESMEAPKGVMRMKAQDRSGVQRKAAVPWSSNEAVAFSTPSAPNKATSVFGVIDNTTLQRKVEEPANEEGLPQAKQEEEPIQRKCKTCEQKEEGTIQRMSIFSATRLEDGCPACGKLSAKVQAKNDTTSSTTATPATAPPIVDSVLTSGTGHTMGNEVKTSMESRMGVDFSNVRIHTDARAAESASAIQAKAYTSGNNVVFGSGQYQPQTDSGRHLLAHELTHVVQQNPGISRKEEPAVAPPAPLDPCAVYQTEKPAVEAAGDKEKTDIPGNKKSQEVPSPVAAAPVEVPALATAPAGPEKDAEAANPPAPEVSPKSPKEDSSYQAVKGETKLAKNSQEKHADATAKAQEAELNAKNPDLLDTKVDQANRILGVDEKVNTGNQPAFDKTTFKLEVLELVKKELADIESESEHNEHKRNGEGKLKQAGKTTVQEGAGSEKEALANTATNAGPTSANGSIIPEKKPFADPVPEEPGRKARIGEAERAVPKPVTDAEVQMTEGKDAEAVELAMENNELNEFGTKLTEDQIENSEESSFTDNLKIKKEKQALLCQVPNQLRQEDATAREQATQTAKGKLARGMKGQHNQRKDSFGNVDTGKEATKSKDELLLDNYYAKIENIYKSAEGDVRNILKDMDECTSFIFEKAIERANATFKSRVTDRLDDYYGVGITNLSEEGDDWAQRHFNSSIQWDIRILKARKKATTDPKARDRIDQQINSLRSGLQETIVMKIFRQEKARFLSTLDNGLDVVALKIEQGMNTAKARIAKGKEDIQCASNCLPQNLQKEAAERTEDFITRFDDLETNVNEKQKEIATSLARDYARNVSKLEETFEKIREEAAKSWWEKALDAIKAIVMAVYRVGKLLVKVLIKAVSVIGDILSSPIKFVKNLFKAVRLGFDNFITNLPTHFENIIFKLILGFLPPGIQLPKSWDPRGMFDFALQVLGLTKENIRLQLVERLGEPIVEKLEKSFDLLQIFKRDGLAGLWDHIKEKIGDLKERVIGSIKEFFQDQVIRKAIKFLLSALSPISGFIKACITLVDVVKFFLKNLENILKLLDSILDSFIDIAKGNVAAAAKRVEQALANILLIGLKFLAALIGINFDKISAKIMKLFNGIRTSVNRAIKWLMDKAYAFAEKTGLVALAKKGKAAFDKGKDKVVGAAKGVKDKVLGFLGLKVTKRMSNGETHSLSIGDDPDAALIIASTPQSYHQFLDKIRTDENADLIEEARIVVGAFYRKRGEAIDKSAGRDAAERQRNAKRKVLESILLKDLWPITSQLLEKTEEGHTGEKGDPIPLIWYKVPLAKYPVFNSTQIGKLEPKHRETIEVHPSLIGPDLLDHLTIGVDSSNEIKKGDILHRRKDLRSRKTRAFWAVFGYYGVDLTGYHVDHVKDINWGGDDEYHNLWPLESSVNTSSGAQNNQQIVVWKVGESLRPIPAGAPELMNKEFIVKDTKEP